MFSQATVSNLLPVLKRSEAEPSAVGVSASRPAPRVASAIDTEKQPRLSRPPQIKKIATWLAAVSAVIGLSMAGYHWFSYASTHEETDDAYTTAHIHPISARINDTVLKVLVDDNQHVKKGDLLVLLDPNDYQVRVDQALAALENARRQAQAAKISIDLAATNASGKSTEATGNVDNALAGIARSKSAVEEAKSAIPQAQAELTQKQAEEHRTRTDLVRYQQLAEQGAVSVQQRDQALRDYQVAAAASQAAQDGVLQAQSRLEQALQSVKAASAQLIQSQGLMQQTQSLHVQTQMNAEQYQVAQAAINQSQAQLHDAQLQLSYTRIVAPTDGRIGKKSVEEGQRVQPGQQLMTVVADDVWVIGNFKETQLEAMRKGQSVDVTIDSFPHHKFKGHIDSESPGSGATFALLPPENATGNFTKIVQRVPVKITFDPVSTKGYEQLIVPGMSAVANVSISR